MKTALILIIFRNENIYLYYYFAVTLSNNYVNWRVLVNLSDVQEIKKISRVNTKVIFNFYGRLIFRCKVTHLVLPDAPDPPPPHTSSAQHIRQRYQSWELEVGRYSAFLWTPGGVNHANYPAIARTHSCAAPPLAWHYRRHGQCLRVTHGHTRHTE